MARYNLALLALLVALPGAAPAQGRPQRSARSSPRTPRVAVPPVPPSADSLAAISRRGRRLAEYDRIAWLATGAIASPDESDARIRQLIAHRTDRGWEVAEGALTAKGDAFLISNLATLSWGSARPRKSIRLEVIAIVGLLIAALLTEPWWTLVAICVFYLALLPVAIVRYARVRRLRATAPEA